MACLTDETQEIQDYLGGKAWSQVWKYFWFYRQKDGVGIPGHYNVLCGIYIYISQQAHIVSTSKIG